MDGERSGGGGFLGGLVALVAPLCCLGLPLLAAAGLGVATAAIAGGAVLAATLLALVVWGVLRAQRRTSSCQAAKSATLLLQGHDNGRRKGKPPRCRLYSISDGE